MVRRTGGWQALCHALGSSCRHCGGLSDAVEQDSRAHSKALRESQEHPHPRIALASLDASHVGQCEAAGVGYLLLREAAFGADSEDISSEAFERIASHGGIVVA